MVLAIGRFAVDGSSDADHLQCGGSFCDPGLKFRLMLLIDFMNLVCVCVYIFATYLLSKHKMRFQAMDIKAANVPA